MPGLPQWEEGRTTADPSPIWRRCDRATHHKQDLLYPATPRPIVAFHRGEQTQSSQNKSCGSERSVFLGWSLSALAHGAILAVAAVFDFQPARLPAIPANEPFRWEVSLIASPKNEPMVAQGIRSQEAIAEAEPDLQSTIDARPSQPSEDFRHMGPSHLPEAVVSQAVHRPSVHRTPSVSEHSTVPADRTAQTTPLAVAMPDTSLLPPPALESQLDASRLQVETQVENPPVLQRPQSITRPLITRTALPDYSWLMETLRAKLEGVKVYPRSAKSAHVQGRVVIQVIVHGDGRLVNPEIEESSGYFVLDQAALDALRAASPLQLDHLLESAPVLMSVPLNYQLE